MKVPPYTTAKGIQIGCRYEPPPHAPTQEELDMQAVLLGHSRRDTVDSIILFFSILTAIGIVIALVKGLA
jgi:hypothetical protein